MLVSHWRTLRYRGPWKIHVQSYWQFTSAFLCKISIQTAWFCLDIDAKTCKKSPEACVLSSSFGNFSGISTIPWWLHFIARAGFFLNRDKFTPFNFSHRSLTICVFDGIFLNNFQKWPWLWKFSASYLSLFRLGYTFVFWSFFSFPAIQSSLADKLRSNVSFTEHEN